jgi:ParB family chromosome partitioning protein
MGAVKGVAETLERLRASGAQSLDPDQIAPSPFVDRIDVSEDIEPLRASIAEFGQKIPILVRPKVNEDHKHQYEVIYGRRRLEACRILGRPVQALVAEMSDQDAVRLQAIENVERLETSFIERALFGAQLEAAGYKQDFILATLKVDEPAWSRMRSTIRCVPRSVIDAIGPARRSGRRPWLELRDLIEEHKPKEATLLKLIRDREASRKASTESKSSKEDEDPSRTRLAALIADFRKSVGPKRPGVAKTEKRYAAGKLILDRKGSALTLRAKSNDLQLFLDDLETRLEVLYQDWKQRDKS